MIRGWFRAAAVALSVAALYAAALPFAATAQVVRQSDPGIDSAVQQAMTKRSGTESFWSGKGGVTGTVIPKPAYSRASGETCSECTDPCRGYEVQAANSRGQTWVYSGEACLNFDSGRWEARGPLRLIAAPVERAPTPPPVTARAPAPAPAVASSPSQVAAPRQLPPAPGGSTTLAPAAPALPPVQLGSSAPALLPPPAVSLAAGTDSVRAVQQGLSTLRYYRGPATGVEDAPTRAAVREFMMDEREPWSEAITPAVLARVEMAVRRRAPATCRTRGARAFEACVRVR